MCSFLLIFMLVSMSPGLSHTHEIETKKKVIENSFKYLDPYLEFHHYQPQSVELLAPEFTEPQTPPEFSCSGKTKLNDALDEAPFLDTHNLVIKKLEGRYQVSWQKTSKTKEYADFLIQYVKDTESSPDAKQSQLLKDFFSHPAGKIWGKAILDELSIWIKKGYFELNLRSGESKALQDCFLYELSEDGEFEIKARLFRVSFVDDFGAFGTGSRLIIGKLGSHFSHGKQKIDPIAIYSHEFGHTRYGNMGNAESETILGEACTVKLYENPVRLFNGFKPRNSYYSTKRNCMITIPDSQVRPIYPNKPSNCFGPL